MNCSSCSSYNNNNFRFTRGVKNNSINMSKIINQDDKKKINKNISRSNLNPPKLSSPVCNTSPITPVCNKKVLVKKILVASGTSTHNSCKIR